MTKTLTIVIISLMSQWKFVTKRESVACLVEKENLFKDKDKYTFQNVRTLTLVNI